MPVIGTGGAGLQATIQLADLGVDVLAVGKRPRNDAHTALAAGGINAALGTMDPDDSWQHAADTILESYRLANPKSSRSRREAPRRGSAIWNATECRSPERKTASSSPRVALPEPPFFMDPHTSRPGAIPA